jgi:hypothetical protein
MRTKTLLLSAAALSAGLLSSVAQSNVFSANVVGYINFNLTNGFNLIASQLTTDATPSNNTLQSVFGTNMPINTTVYAFVPASGQFLSASYSSTKSGASWGGSTNAVNAALGAGGSVFVQTPSSVTLTTVGNVVQGTNVIPVAAGFNLLGSVAPISGGIQTVMGYSPKVGDTVYIWNPATQGYTSSSFNTTKSGAAWSPGEPQISVGQGVFIQSASATGWTNTFSVQ